MLFPLAPELLSADRRVARGLLHDACRGSVMQTSVVGGGYGYRSNDRQTDFAVNVTLSLGASYSFPGGTTISVIFSLSTSLTPRSALATRLSTYANAAR